ncbi:MAG: carboxylating nicotinate-nucleotide diphosphorylase [Bacteroidales bacterium]|nr:carboxylating nicotinate-nucleotide diphosphorylase [Bacteroidales bacterium]
MTIEEFVLQAIREDVGDGDHSSLLSVPSEACGKAQLLVKENGVIAGVNVALKVFETVDKNLNIHVFKQDGTRVYKGDIVLEAEGCIRSILMSERLVLNIMQRMSGIATKTAYYCSLVKGTNVKLLDTRKTTPNMRMLEKMAVKIGGGENHRFGLYDMIMLKDNHVDYAGGITQAIRKAQQYLSDNHLNIKVEIETRNLQEVQEVLQTGGVDRIMFDNFTPDNVRKGVEMVAHTCETEASGNITESTILSYAQTGVDFISVGALTHSVKSLDLSLKAKI